MGRASLPARHNVFDSTFQCVAVRLVPFGLTWQHLKAQAIQESNLDPKAVSPTGPRGIMQFTADTGSEYGLFEEADFFDPGKSIDAGARYMAWLLEILRDGTIIGGRKIDPVLQSFECWQMALAAYNQGIGNLSKAVDRSRRFGVDVTEWACVANGYTPIMLTGPRCREVLNYVARIKKVYALLKQHDTLPPAMPKSAAA